MNQYQLQLSTSSTTMHKNGLEIYLVGEVFLVVNLYFSSKTSKDVGLKANTKKDGARHALFPIS